MTRKATAIFKNADDSLTVDKTINWWLLENDAVADFGSDTTDASGVVVLSNLEASVGPKNVLALDPLDNTIGGFLPITVIEQAPLVTASYPKYLPLGDSITNLGQANPRNVTTGATVYDTRGFWVAAQSQVKSPFYALDELGTPFDTAIDVLARMGPVLASGADVVGLMLGVNDLSDNLEGGDIGLIAANIGEVVDQCIAGGMKVLLLKATELTSTTGNVSKARVQLLNIELEAIAAVTADCEIIDSNYTDYNEDVASNTYDNIHPNTRGATMIGRIVAEAMDQYVESTAVWADVLPALTGTSGNVGSGSGQLPNGYVATDGIFNIDGSEIDVVTPVGSTTTLDTEWVPCVADSEYFVEVSLAVTNPGNVSSANVRMTFQGGTNAGETQIYVLTPTTQADAADYLQLRVPSNDCKDSTDVRARINLTATSGNTVTFTVASIKIMRLTTP